MPLFSDVHALQSILPVKGCLIGLDHGRKSIGIAVSDFERRIASPLATVSEKKFTARAQRILTICSTRVASGIVLGLPLNMDGTQGRQCQSVRAFAYNLQKWTEIPIAFADERLSTSESYDVLTELGVGNASKNAKSHSVAASIMLQRALDELVNSVGTR